MGFWIVVSQIRDMEYKYMCFYVNLLLSTRRDNRVEKFEIQLLSLGEILVY